MEKKEIKVCGSCLSSNLGRKFHESDFDMRLNKGHKLAGIDTCLDCGSDDIYTVKKLLDKAREEGFRNALAEVQKRVGIEDAKTYVLCNAILQESLLVEIDN